jgi:hypothetical protein
MIMKKIFTTLSLTLILLLGVRTTSLAQTTLAKGDVVIVAINGDADASNSYGRGFSFMPLVNLEAGTVINFTDYGWSDVTGAFITNTSVADVFIHYTAPSVITAGTIIRCDSYHTTDFTADYSYAGGILNNYLNIAGLTQGDELLVFQGLRSSPTFICAASIVNNTLVPSGWATSVGTNGTDGSGAGSALPPGLTDDVTALSFNQVSTANDNCSYSGPTAGATKAEWQTRIQNYSNWTFNDAIPIPTPPTGPFYVGEPVVAPTVTTTAALAIATTSATLGGNVTADGGATVSAHGIVYSTSDATPTIAEGATSVAIGSGGTGSFSQTISSLSPNTLYYYNAYATNSAGTSYGTPSSFTTLPVAPTVTTQAVSSIASTTATGNGNITALGVPNPTAYGVCWNTTGTPTTSDSKVDNGAASSTGAFTASMTSLSANTTYYVRAFATNTAGTSYGTEVSFTSLSIAPTVTTQAVSSIASTTATGNGNITSLGVPNPTAYGVCWNTTGTPTISNSKVDKGAASSTGAFTAPMTSLSANTTYYVRAFATNTAGTSYGTEVSFTSLGTAPTVTTQAVTSIASTTATGNGNITSLGVPNPTAYGVCWNTTGTPTTSDSKVDKGAASTTGAFTASMTSLSANTTYYVRAFATNTAGTSYGTEVSFTTSGIAPTVTTQAVSSIASTTATGNGNITALGVPNPTAYGVCWNTTGTPTTSDSKVDKGAASSTGAFTASMTSLSANTTYYIRAYATNSAVTSYGSQVSFTTNAISLPTIAFSTTSSSGAESVSSANLQVELSAASASNVTVDYSVTGTATGAGTDYTLANGTLTITAGNTTSNITIASIVDDALVEGNETVIVTLSNPSNATLGTNTVHTYTITNNDNATNVSEISKGKVSVHPNPFADMIYFDNLSNDISQIIITDLTGHTVLNIKYKGEECLRLDHLSSGTYLLTIINNVGEKQVLKIVKE